MKKYKVHFEDEHITIVYWQSNGALQGIAEFHESRSIAGIIDGKFSDYSRNLTYRLNVGGEFCSLSLQTWAFAGKAIPQEIES